MHAATRNKLTLATLILTFAIPALLAGLLYWHGMPLSGKTTNYGQLLEPPMAISDLAPTDTNLQTLSKKDLLGKWTLLTLSPATCEKACQTSLYNVRQICKATGKEQTRLRQVVLTLQDQAGDPQLTTQLNNHYPQTKQWLLERSTFKQLTGATTELSLNQQQGALYLIDPLGNIMMRYEPTANPTGIFKDLSKLLRISQIG